MDARDRQRFQENAQLLVSWVSATTVLGGGKRGVPEPALVETPVTQGRQGGTSAGGSEVRPPA